MKQIYFLFFFILLSASVQAQSNTEFWFVAPEVTSGHGDRPIYLYLTSFDEAATVTITQPANAAFAPIVINIPANGTWREELTSRIDMIENKPPNTVLPYGINITATKPITAYYEEAFTNNTDIFTLKGNNALGTDFYIPSQDFFYNQQLTPSAYNTFDIVATEDNTTITITPSNDIFGHSKADGAFTIVLNKGETYSAQATVTGTASAAGHLMGSHVTSDKPIAITFKDDSVRASGQGCYDLIGDQIVPVPVIGTQYVAVRGYLNTAINDRVYIVATMDNTDIFRDGNPVPVATKNTSELFSFSIPQTSPASYIEASHPVYVLHVSGYGCEVGGALLPPINCTGSDEIAFTRSTVYDFGLIIITKDAAKGSFTIDGDPTLVPASAFTAVPGNPGMVYARIEYNTAQIKENEPHIIANSTDIFHLGIINASGASGTGGCRYGYFSNFADLNLGPDAWICPGNSKVLDAGPGRTSYAWSTGETTQTITVSTPGTYSVTVDDHGCILSDEVVISHYSSPAPTLGPDQVICPGQQQTITLDAGGTYVSYLWNTGATTPSISVNSAGIYSVTVTDGNTCPGSASVNITERPYPVPLITGPPAPCIGSVTIPYHGEPDGTNYQWNVTAGGTNMSGQGTRDITIDWTTASPQQLTLTLTDVHGCTPLAPATYAVDVKPLPVPTLSGPPSVCPGISGKVYATEAGKINYQWSYSAGGTKTAGGELSDPTITLTWNNSGPQTVHVGYTDGFGCISASPAEYQVTVNPDPTPLITGPTPVCELSNPAGVYSSPFLTGHSYSWNVSGGTIQPTANPNEIKVLWGPSGPASISLLETSNFGCQASALPFSVILEPKPLSPGAITGLSAVCDGSNGIIYTLPSITHAISYSWNYSGTGGSIHDATVNPITVDFSINSGSGNFTVYGINQCGNGPVSAAYPVTIKPLPDTRLENCINLVMSQTARPFTLKGGFPLGLTGSYAIDNITIPSGILDPSLLAVGSHNLTYTYTNALSCSKTAGLPFSVISNTFSCGQNILDARDDESYRTFLISGKCWMGENLRIGSRIPDAQHQTNNCAVEKHCISTETNDHCQNYGGLYQWDELMRFETTAGTQGLCPGGWHIPTAIEWQALIDALGGNSIASGAFQDFTLSPRGFEAFARGIFYGNYSWAFNTGTLQAGMFWTSTASGDKVLARGLNTNGLFPSNPSVSLYPAVKSNAFSVRCLKD